MDFVNDMKARAKTLQKRLVLAEGTEERTLRAARIIVDQGLAASVTLVGNEAAVRQAAAGQGVGLEGIQISDPEKSPRRAAYGAEYYRLVREKDEAKRAKGKTVDKPMTEEKARAEILHCLRWGAMLVHLGDADALVAGAESATADVLRAGLSVIGTSPGSRTASSCFVMTGLDKGFGVEGSLIFSDCAVVPAPTAEQLADIAASAAQSCREFLGAEPVAALLSFSTKGSAGHENVTRVQEAVEILKGRNPGFIFDGELQADAALAPAVTDKKAPGSPVRGKVNTLIFPDLGAGNIGYKLVQRLGGAEAFGPFLQGFAKPVSDLSRGASVEDIVVTCAVTLARAG